VGRNYVLTFQERPGDCFDAVRKRIREARPKIRGGGPDYLAYAILDAITDSYFPLLDEWSDQLEEIESEIVAEPRRESLIRLYELKRRFVEMRRILTSTRDALNALVRDDNPIIGDDVRIYLRDAYDHSIQLVDSLDGNREYASSLMDFYLSQNGNRMNEIMKVLTIIATIFIPLTFIAGIYGMNFDPDASPWNMPELGWYWGYPAAWGAMLIVGIALLIYFRKKGWLG
jgi:magnesium transporter